MQALICNTPNEFVYQNCQMPIVQNGQTLLKIERVGICGTDIHAFDGTQPYFNYPRILGHELSATIIQTTDNNFSNNELVTIIPYFNCNTCIACINNKPNCCTAIKVFGVHIDGGMREFVVVPNTALIKSNGLGVNELALVEPLAIGAHSLKRAMLQKNEFVFVIGAGPIGLGIMQLAKIAKANVIAMDINESRLLFCKNKLGIEYTINALNENIIAQLQLITNNNMPTVIIDATGNLKAINNAFQYLAHGGRYVLVGLQKDNITFSHPEFHKRESTLMSSRNATKEDFNHVIECIKNGLIVPENFITHTVKFANVKDQFPSLANPNSGVIKAMISF